MSATMDEPGGPSTTQRPSPSPTPQAKGLSAGQRELSPGRRRCDGRASASQRSPAALPSARRTQEQQLHLPPGRPCAPRLAREAPGNR